MAIFPSIDPSYGAQKRSEPVVRTVQFGDGYQARLTMGLNQNPKEWSLEWRNITESEDTIENFSMQELMTMQRLTGLHQMTAKRINGSALLEQDAAIFKPCQYSGNVPRSL